MSAVPCYEFFGASTREANSEQVDLIVIENTRLGIISKMAAMGSTSRYVAEGASCPVMIVR